MRLVSVSLETFLLDTREISEVGRMVDNRLLLGINVILCSEVPLPCTSFVPVFQLVAVPLHSSHAKSFRVVDVTVGLLRVQDLVADPIAGRVHVVIQGHISFFSCR